MAFDIGTFANGFEDDGIKYVPVGELVDEFFTITRFVLFTSKNTEKYSSNNERGVMIWCVDSEGEEFKTTTHSKVLVSIFENIKKRNAQIPDDIKFTLVKNKSGGGREYFTLVQITKPEEE